MTFPDIHFELQGAVAIVRLARPAKRNAISDGLIRTLRDVFESMPDGVRAVVLDGEGDHFCAGLDLSELTERDAGAGLHHSRMWHAALETVQFGPAPVIAALHGAVVGGGLELAAACHIRVADDTAFYSLPEGSRGIFVGGGGAVRLPRLIGVARMVDMMLTGRTYSAEEGQTIGLSTYLVEPDKGFARALELAERIAGNAPLTNYAVMHVLPRIATMAPQAGFAVEALMAAIAQADPEAKARLRDFLEKRAPKVTRD